jgi:hypothetical protein
MTVFVAALEDAELLCTVVSDTGTGTHQVTMEAHHGAVEAHHGAVEAHHGVVVLPWRQYG